MSCGMFICIECEYRSGLSWGDTRSRCPRCNGRIAVGFNNDDCEKERHNLISIMEEANLKFNKETGEYEDGQKMEDQ